jgi:hypothetical protein
LEKLNRILDEAKVNVATIFLTGTKNLWWRNQAEELETERTKKKIENWAEMKVALKAQFGMGNQAWITRNQLLA